MKVLITGGHVTPALAVIDTLLANPPLDFKKNDIVFVGRQYTDRRREQTSFEYHEVTKRDIRFVNLESGRLTRMFSFHSLIDILRFPYGLIQSIQIISHERPDSILSFGGYLALPLCIAGILLRKRIYVHEQTLYPGISNRLIAPFAKIIFVSFAHARRFFPVKKTVLSGNPLRPAIFKKAQNSFYIPTDKPVVYITGGSLGAHSLNLHVSRILERLVKLFTVVHQTGNVKEYNDFGRLIKQRSKLRNDLKKRYIVKEHISDDEIGYVFSCADVVVTRAGANTFFELIALDKPAVFVPLPWSAHQEQKKHAELFKEKKAGELFNQSHKSEILLELIELVIQKKLQYKKNILLLKDYIHPDASETIIQTIFNTS